MTIPLIANRETWREGKVRPIPGKPSARPAGKPGDFCFVKGEFATIPSPPLRSVAWNTEALSMRFSGMAESIWSDGVGQAKPTQTLGRNQLPPAGRPRAQVKERAGRNTLLLIVRR